MKELCISSRRSYGLGVALDTPFACLRADLFVNAYLSAGKNQCGCDILPFQVVFNTNTLTSLVYGMKRSQQLRDSLEDPFLVIDCESVGSLMEIAIYKIR